MLLLVRADNTPRPVGSKINSAGRIEYTDYPESANQIVITSKQVVNDYQCVSAPGNPPSGNVRVYCDSSSGLLACKTSAGASCSSNGAAAGSTTQVQFNDGGVFGGDSTFAFDKTTKILSASAFSGSFTNTQHVTSAEFSGGTIPSGTTGTILFFGSPTAFTFTGTSCATCDGQRLSFFVFSGGPYSIAGTLNTAVFYIPNIGTADKLTFPKAGTGAIFEYRGGTLFYVGGAGFIPSFNGTANAELDLGYAGVSSGVLSLIGTTSGSANLGVANVAGTPNKINIPTATGTSGQFLQTDGGNPQQASWATPTLPTTTATNCSSSASPAVCGSAQAGSVVIAAGATTVTVNTTAVTANSQIFVFPDETLGTKLSVTCNSTLATAASGLAITARTAATSFQITTVATIAVNPVCLGYLIIN